MSGDPGELLAAALAAHGGAERFGRAVSLHARVRLRGNILATKLRSPLERSYLLELDPRRPRARVAPFHREEREGLFDGDRVAILEDGREIRSRAGARAHARATRVWDELDLLYFVGYALWNYLLTPVYFQWPDFGLRELEPWRGLRRLEVTYPEAFPTHCPVQVFYFDGDARLVRLDYVAEVLGDRVRGAHLCEDHRRLGGVVVPTHRTVYALGRGLEPLRWLPRAMEGWLEDVTVVETVAHHDSPET
jgi:hypothetical protein